MITATGCEARKGLLQGSVDGVLAADEVGGYLLLVASGGVVECSRGLDISPSRAPSRRRTIPWERSHLGKGGGCTYACNDRSGEAPGSQRPQTTMYDGISEVLS